ncbi:MAG: ISL3 family transposase [Campylobacterales bacterium]|nr:ISL3 family transposase [Campylobacterales bacterium]
MPLNLPYNVLKQEEKEHDLFFFLEPIENNLQCPFCGSKDYRKHLNRKQFYFDLPIRGKRVGLYIKRQRYLCKACSKSFLPDLPLIHINHNMTERLVKYIKEKSLQRPFTHLADEIGCTEGTIRKIFKSHIEGLAAQSKFATPKIMGIDEIHLAKRARAVITNIEERTIIEMFKDRNKTTITHYLNRLENSHIVLNVAMDMWKPYRDAVNSILPHSIVVIDKFHVVRMANTALEKYRKELRRSLTQKQRLDLKNDRYLLLKRKNTLSNQESFTLSYWENNYPILAKMYDLKEQFFEIYDTESKEEAYDRYAEFEAQLTKDIRHYWSDLTRAVENWHTEIFAYFDHPITNAYTEAMNSVIRHVDRMGRSYSFETIRAKMLYTKSIHKTKRPKMNKRHDMDIPTFMRKGDVMGRYIPSKVTSKQEEIKDEINYGVDMEKLVNEIKKGTLRFED